MDAGPYRLGALLGTGASGRVWRAADPDGREVALKVLPGPDDPRRRDVFRREVIRMARLHHPSVLALLDAGTVDHAGGRLPIGTPWLALELAEGSLAERPPRHATATLEVVERVLGALAHAHAHGIVHRDLKPANVLWTAGGWKLADFGIAHALGDDRATVAGTPSAMAPEQWSRQPHRLGPWTDLYALGALVWTLVTGAPPFTGSVAELRLQHEQRSPPEFVPRFPVPAGLEGWVRRLLAKDPAERPSSAPAALAELRSALVGEQATFGALLGVPDWRGEPPPAGPVPLGLFGLRAWSPVGREAAQERLWSLLRSVVDGGRSEVVVLTGTPGAGASALAGWLAARAEELGVARAARAWHHDPATPTDGAPGLFRQALRLEGLTGPEGAEAVRQALPRTGAELAGLVYPDDGEPPATHRRVDVALQALREWAEEEPRVLVLEDVHLSTEAVTLLRRLHRAAVPVLAVATASAAFDEAALPTLPLGPLPAAALRSFLTGSLGLDGPTATALAAACDGRPGVAIDAVAGWVQRGELAQGEGGRAGPATWPLAVDARVASAVRHAAPGVTVALERLALVGVVVDDDLWGALVPPEEHEAARDGMDALEDARLGERLADGFRFADPAVRDALLARSRAGGRYGELRPHAFEGLRRLASASSRAGRHVRAADFAARAIQLAEDDGERLSVAVTQVNVLRATGRADEAVGLAGWALPRVATGSLEHALVVSNLAAARFELGAWTEARTGWEEAVVLHRTLRRASSVALNQRNLAILDRLQGHISESVQAFEALRRAAIEQRDAWNAWRAGSQLARAWTEWGMRSDGDALARAEELFRELLGGAEGVDPGPRCSAEVDLGEVIFLRTGDPAPYVRAMERTAEWGKEQGLVRTAAVRAIEGVRVAVEMGRLAEAQSWSERFAAVVANSPGLLSAMTLRAGEAWLAWAEGRAAATVRLTLAAEPVAAALGVVGEQVDLALLRARATPEPAEADAALALARSLATSRRWPGALADCAAVEAAVQERFERPGGDEVRARAVASADAARSAPFSLARRLLAEP